MKRTPPFERIVGSTLLALACTTGVAAQEQQSTGADRAPREAEYRLGVLLFEGFELLDVMGPLEMFANLGTRCEVVMVAEQRGPIASAQKIQTVAEYTFDDCPKLDLILVPGGRGVRNATKNEALMTWLKERAATAEITASVCTGSDVLAQAGLLDGRKATTNKMAYKLVAANNPNVNWVYEARWVDDGDRVTSSGVSAGIDMSLHIIERLFGAKIAERVANGTEFNWQRDPTIDPFAKLYE